jgi:peptidoglycan/xylan/chitin deacetylase (PgdA/CDA1 family)
LTVPNRLILALLAACVAGAVGSAPAAPRPLVRAYKIGGGSGTPLKGVIGIPATPATSPLVAIVAAPGRARDNAELVGALAAKGFAALAFDPGQAGYARAYERHLGAIESAVAGEASPVGVDLTGRIDLRRIGLLAHSRAVVAAVALARRTRPASLLLVAPADVVGETARPLPDTAFALVVPQCDGVAQELDGRRWYDAARLSKRRSSLAEYVLVHGANHNFFDAGASVDDAGGLSSSPGCEARQRLGRGEQQRWLERYAAAFFRSTLAYKTPTVGLDPSRPAPTRLFGARVTTALVIPAADRLVMRYPKRSGTDLAGGTVVLEGPILARACRRGSSPCRPGTAAGGKPLQLQLAWEGEGAAYTVVVPAEREDLTPFASVSLRASSEAGLSGHLPRFSIVLRDAAGREAAVVVRPPAAETAGDAPGLLGSLRIPLTRFHGLDLHHVADVRLAFDRTPAGTVLLEDLELLADLPLVTAIHALPRTLTLTAGRIRQVLQLAGKGAPVLRAVLTDQTGVVLRSTKVGPLAVGRRAVSMRLPMLIPGAYRIRLVWRGVVESNAVPFRVVTPTDAEVVSIVRNAGNRIALTFDDCLYPSAWASMLTTLASHGAHATFFCNGRNLSGEVALMRRTIQDGNAVGSHTWSHSDLRRLTTTAIERETVLDSDIWWRDAAAETRPFLRPPYGSYDRHVLDAAGRSGHRFVVLWDVDTNDWQKPGAQVIVRRALTRVTPGAIVLLHVLPETAEALPTILEGLAKRGLDAVSLNELLAVPGARPSNGHWPADAAPR